MAQHVLMQMLLVDELLAAKLTAELLRRVMLRRHVSAEIDARRGSLAADLTCVGVRLAVHHALVSAPRVDGAERLVARIAVPFLTVIVQIEEHLIFSGGAASLQEHFNSYEPLKATGEAIRQK